jgi:hypothetical protein
MYALLGLLLAAPVFAKPIGIKIDQYFDPTEFFSFGLGAEGNNYTDGDALGCGLSLLGEFHVNSALSAGMRAGAYYDIDKLITIEPLLFIRVGHTFRKRVRLFVEGDLGAALFRYGGDFSHDFSGGLNGGIRIILKNWYIEPYVRGGYPVLFGGGLLAGYTWGK